MTEMMTPWCALAALAVLLLCLSPSFAGATGPGLAKGDAFHFTVDAGKVVRPVNRQLLGISFFMFSAWVPIYDGKTGEWILSERATEAIRDLHVPFSRICRVDPGTLEQVSWDLKGGIDRAAEICRRCGIRQEDFVVELEQDQMGESTSPERWVEAIRYAKSKGYRFRLWEVVNEPYNGLGDPWTAPRYVAHVKEVYQAVKAADPEAQVGCHAGLSPW
ncbi:MAG: hypothetical protein MUQ65_12950, partial [Armatimonadetes bacterium]|nr:hypothetical protein [Armatimonadota bacterium]